METSLKHKVFALMAKKDREQTMWELLGDAYYFKVPLAFVRTFTPPEALILSYLINLEAFYARLRKEREKNDFDGWFYCKAVKLETDLGLNERAQNRFIRLLRQQKILDIRMKHNPNRRYIKLNRERILKLLESA